MSEDTTVRKDHNVWPGLFYDDPMAARRWLAALGFEEGGCYLGEDGTSVQHSEMLWPDGGRVMVASRKDDPSHPNGRTSVYVVVADPDAVHERAVALGATITRPLEEADYGSRGFSLLDPEGNGWSFGTYAG